METLKWVSVGGGLEDFSIPDNFENEVTEYFVDLAFKAFSVIYAILAPFLWYFQLVFLMKISV